MGNGILSMFRLRNKLFLCVLLSSIFTIDAFSSEECTYNFSWLDPDKEVYVLQNRKFRKAKRVFLSLGAGTQVSGAFVDSTHFQARAGYYFRENWGITLLYGSASGEENTTAESVRSNGTIPFRRTMNGYTGAMLMWSPFYSKLNTFNTIFYYDLIFGLGVSSLDFDSNRPEVDANVTSDSRINETYTALTLDIGTKFFISNNWSADVNLTTFIFNAANGARTGNTGAGEKRTSHWDLTFGVGYTF